MKKLSLSNSLVEVLNESKYDDSRRRMIAFIEKELNSIRKEADNDGGALWKYQTVLWSFKNKIEKENY